MAAWPSLPVRAAYLALNNAKRRNALSTAVLQDIRSQLIKYNTCKRTGQLRLLPPFQPALITKFESALQSPESSDGKEYGWLVNSSQWHEERKDLPNVLVLRSEGAVFSSGHDLGEIRGMSYDSDEQLFDLCAEVMSLMRRSPIPVIGAIHGLATAAGCQLALNTDIPIASASTQFRLPGTMTGFPCSSPVTAASRRLGNAFGYRMLSLAEPYRADQLPPGIVDVVPNHQDYETQVSDVVARFAEQTPARPQAFAKWAYWTQASMNEAGVNSDGTIDAAAWSGRVMALHLQGQEARDGIEAFFSMKTSRSKL